MGSLEGFREVPDRMLPDEGVAAGALGRTPPSTPLRGQQPARSAVRRPRPPPEGEQASRPAPYIQVKSR
jgi:hypothetical protein